MTLLFFGAAVFLLVELFPSSVRDRLIGKGSERAKPPIAFKWLTAALLVYFLLIVVPLFFLNSRETALFFTGTYLHFLFAPALLIGLFQRNRHETYISSFIKGLRAGVPIAAVIAIVQFLITGERPHGFMGNALVFATISMISGFAAMVVLKDDTKFDRYFAVAAFISGTIIVVLANARGMMITWPFLAIILGLHLWRSRENGAANLKMIAVPFALTILLTAGMFTVSQQMRDVFQFRILAPVQALLQGEVPERAIQSRAIMLSSGWAAFTQKPITGFGIANTVSEANKITETEFGPEYTTSRTHLHNDYLNHLVGGGLILFVSFLSVLLAPIWLSKSVPDSALNATDPVRSYFTQIITVGFAMSAMTNLLFGHDLLQSYFLICTIFIAIDATKDASVSNF